MHQQHALNVLFVLLFVNVANGALGIDIYEMLPTTVFQCLTNNGYSFMSMRCYRSYGAVDPNCPGVMANGKAGGIKYRDVYIFPCYKGVTAQKQVADTVNYLKSTNTDFGMLWFDIEENPSAGCGWETASTNLHLNCDFLQQLLDAGHTYNLTMGIYSTNYEWNLVMGGNACQRGASYPLWYANWDGQQNFNDFVPFGGWTKPAVKQYVANLGNYCQLNN